LSIIKQCTLGNSYVTLMPAIVAVSKKATTTLRCNRFDSLGGLR
jgi:hypothetical protein